MEGESLKYAEEQMQEIQKLEKYLPSDYKESILNIIRLELVAAYRRGCNDALRKKG